MAVPYIVPYTNLMGHLIDFPSQFSATIGGLTYIQTSYHTHSDGTSNSQYYG